MDFSISTFSAISIVIPAIAGAILFRNLNSNIRILYVLIVATLVLAIISEILKSQGNHSLVPFHLYIYFEFTAFAVIFYRLYDTKVFKAIAASFLVLFALYSALFVRHSPDVELYDPGQRYLCGFMIMVLCVGYFMQIIRKVEHRYLSEQPYFWLNVGLVSYYTASLFFYLVGGQLISKDLLSFWEYHSVLNFGLNIIFLIVIVKGNNRQKEQLLK